MTRLSASIWIESIDADGCSIDEEIIISGVPVRQVGTPTPDWDDIRAIWAKDGQPFLLGQTDLPRAIEALTEEYYQ